MRRVGMGLALALIVGLAAVAGLLDSPADTTSSVAPGVANSPSVAGIRWPRHGVMETAGIRWRNWADPDRQAPLL